MAAHKKADRAYRSALALLLGGDGADLNTLVKGANVSLPNYARPESIDNANLPASKEDFRSRLTDSELSMVRNIASQFLAHDPCKTGALVTTAFYLCSTAEFVGPSMNETESIAHWLHAYATNLGYQIHESADELTERILNHQAKHKNPWHHSIDSAIYRARCWILGEDVPREIRYVAREAGIRSKARYAVLCVAWALQEQGDSWFIHSDGLEGHLQRHGILATLSGRTVRAVLGILSELGFTQETADSSGPSGARRCKEYAFSLPVDFAAPDELVFRRGGIEKSSFSPSLKPIYEGCLSPPSCVPLAAVTAAPAAFKHSPPSRDKTHGGMLQVGQRMVEHRFQSAAKADVLEAGRGKEMWVLSQLAETKNKISARATYAECPCCRKPKKLGVLANGNLGCVKTKRQFNVIDAIAEFNGLSFYEALGRVAELLRVEGKPRVRALKASHKPKSVPHETCTTLETVADEYANLKGITAAGMEHYGAISTLIDGTPCIQAPLRTADMTPVSTFTAGLRNSMWQKGFLPKGKMPDSAFLPNDFDAKDGKPLPILSGIKDPVRVWELTSGGVHAIGIQCSRMPPDIVAAARGRAVVIIPDCDPSGRRDAHRWANVLKANGATCVVRDWDRTRNDSSDIRDFAKEDEPRLRKLLTPPDPVYTSNQVKPVGKSAATTAGVDFSWIDGISL